MSERAPKIRTDIEVVPTLYQGEKAFLIRDALGLIPDPIVLKGQGLAFLQLIDGRREPRDIQIELIRASNNSFVSLETVQGFLSDLDKAGILDSENYRRNKTGIVEDYQKEKVRTAHLQGEAYPESAADLGAVFDAMFERNKPSKNVREIGRIRALAAPHIDLKIGAGVYTQAYHAVWKQPPSQVLLLGTGHNLTDNFFAVTEKDFKTPFGLIRTDKDWVRRLSEAQDVVSSYDICHKNEHSLEFQLLFLQYLFGSEFKLVPVLCGSFLPVIDSYSRLSEIPEVNGFLNILKQYLEEDPSTLVVAGVDFFHIGPKFGHSQPAVSILPEAKKHDSLLISALCRGDGAGFWKEIKETRDEYNICGFSALACLLDLLPGVQGHLLGYDFWEEGPTQSAVSFAAIAFT